MKNKFTLLLSLLSFFLLFYGCNSSVDKEQARKQISRVLDDWHNAAAEAEYERYFNHFAGDSAIFMGTDATERWTAMEFKFWAKPYFDRGSAWDFTPMKRHIYFSDNGKTAWFDESLDTPNLGLARGSGVVVKKSGNWKIAHYNLSIPIPNAIIDSVVQQVKEERKRAKSAQ